MTDEALVEADRLEEAGRWEEAAIMRLTGGEHGGHYPLVGGEVHAWPERLRVQTCAGQRYGYWLWRDRMTGWNFYPAPYVGVRRPAEQCPPEVRRAVEEAVRQVLERRFGGGR